MKSQRVKTVAIFATIAAMAAALWSQQPQPQPKVVEAPLPGVSSQSYGVQSLGSFGPTSTPTITPTPTQTSTPDADGHLPHPNGVTRATRTFPGDHYPTAVAFLQNAIGNGTPAAIGTEIPMLVPLFSPRRGPGYGVALSPTQAAGLMAQLSAAPQATPRVQGYFLGFWGTAVPDVVSGKIALVTTFWNSQTPVPFPTKERWFDPTAQAQTLRPAGSSINTVPLVFVFEATTGGSFHLSEILDGTGDYEQTVKTLQQQGWGPYYTFRTP